MASVAIQQQENRKDTLYAEDVLQILKDLGGHATRQEIKEKALERYTEHAVASIGFRLNKLHKWQDIDIKYDKRGRLTYTVIPHETKTQEQIEEETKRAMQSITLMTSHKQVPKVYCPACQVRLNIFDEPAIVRFQRSLILCHPKCEPEIRKRLDLRQACRKVAT